MNTEFSIDVNGQYIKIYMQSGFFDHADISYPMHKHSFSEMHVLLNGTAVLTCDQEDFILNAGDALLIPANVLHQYRSFTKDSKRLSFFIDDIKRFSLIGKSRIPQAFLPFLCKEIQEYVLAGSDSKLRALLSYICSDFWSSEKPVTPIANRDLIVEHFFSQKYHDPVTVEDLAKELMLSCKQTEREVKRITGRTFVAELSQRRIHAAIILSQTTN